VGLCVLENDACGSLGHHLHGNFDINSAANVARLNRSFDPDIVRSLHLHAGGLDDRTILFEVPMNARFEFIEGRDVGLA